MFIKKFNNQLGFTLVELSIVLVIIGLLVGGILVGQSLIDSVKVNSQLQQIQQFDAAIAGFKSKYKFLPGDATNMPNPGNGDNRIIDFDPNQSQASFQGEVKFFWAHLSISGLTGYSFTTASATTCVSTQCNWRTQPYDIAPAKIDSKLGIMVAYDNGVVITNRNQYFFGGYDAFGAFEDSSPNVSKCSLLAAFDQKFDDGVPTSGAVGSPWCNSSNLYNMSALGTIYVDIMSNGTF